VVAHLAREALVNSCRRTEAADSRNKGRDVSVNKAHPHVIVAALVVAASPLGAGEPLTIRVSPGFAFAPATLVVNAVAQVHPANRARHIELLSDYYRSSVIPLDGDQDAITTTVQYGGVPGGKYEVSAILWGSNAKTGGGHADRGDSFQSRPLASRAKMRTSVPASCPRPKQRNHASRRATGGTAFDLSGAGMRTNRSLWVAT
jgi:hypothetical protein